MRRLVFFVIAGMMILGQFGRYELPRMGAIYVHDIAIVFLCIMSLWSFRKSIFSLILHSSLFHAAALFSIWVLISSIYAFHNDFTALLVALLYLGRFLVYVSLGVIVRQMSIRGELTRSELRGWLVTVVVGISLLGFFQYVLVPDTRGLALLGWDDHYYRLISTIFDPGFTGIIMVMGSFVLLEWVVRTRALGWWLLYAALCVAILLTYSRASYLAWIIGVMLYSWKIKRYWFCMVIPLFLFVMLGLPRPGGEGVRLERTASVVARADSVSDAFSQMSPSEYLTGRGWYWKKSLKPMSDLAGVQVPNHSSAAENSYVFLISAVGVIGAGMWVWMGYQFVRQTSGDALVWSVTGAIAMHALFTNTWMYGFVIIYYGVIMAYSAPRSLMSSRLRQH